MKIKFCPECGFGSVKDIIINRTEKDEKNGEVEKIEDLKECLNCKLVY